MLYTFMYILYIYMYILFIYTTIYLCVQYHFSLIFCLTFSFIFFSLSFSLSLSPLSNPRSNYSLFDLLCFSLFFIVPIFESNRFQVSPRDLQLLVTKYLPTNLPTDIGIYSARYAQQNTDVRSTFIETFRKIKCSFVLSRSSFLSNFTV